ncbi:MAG: hypothetical protein ABI165_03545, partial [Bryobacteraceae bacterium]
SASAINATNGVGLVPENIQLLGGPNLTYDQRLRLEYYNSTVIPPQRIGWNVLYDLPFGRGKHFGGSTGRGLNALIGGWQLASIGSWSGGNWLSVNAGEYVFSNPSLGSGQQLEFNYSGKLQRLYFKGDFDPTKASGIDLNTLEQLIPVDRGARAIHPVGGSFDNRIGVPLANGTVRQTAITDTLSWNPRAFILGPSNWNVDASVFKNFNLTEALHLRFTADLFNALNHPVDPAPNASTGLQDLTTQTNSPRIIQLSLKLQW